MIENHDENEKINFCENYALRTWNFLKNAQVGLVYILGQ